MALTDEYNHVVMNWPGSLLATLILCIGNTICWGQIEAYSAPPRVREPDSAPTNNATSPAQTLTVSFESSFQGDSRCLNFSKVFYGADNQSLKRFLRPAVDLIAADLGVTTQLDITFSRPNFDVAAALRDQ